MLIYKEKIQIVLNSIYSLIDKGSKKMFIIKILQQERKQN